MNKKGILKGILTIILFSIGAKLMSFIIELIIAYCFGATSETDVYYLVSGITQIITPMITIGIWKVFMPAYKEKQVIGDIEGAKRITDELMVVFVSFCIALMGIMLLFPRVFTLIFAPGFKGDSLNLAHNLIRITSPLFIFVIASVFYSAILQANRLFAKSQSKYLVEHIPTLLYLIVVIVFGIRVSVYGLTITIVIGEIIALITVAFFAKNNYVFSIPQSRLSEDSKQVLRLVPAACLNSIINQLDHVVDKAFGSILQPGSLTYLNYGNKLVGLFDGLVSTAFSTALFPQMAEYVAREDKKGFKNFISKYILTLLSILLPVTILICIYKYEIVKIVFGHGNFNDISVRSTSVVLQMYGIGLIAMGFNTVFNDVLYVNKKAKLLVITNVINIISNLVLDFCLIKVLDVAGLSLATTISLYLSLAIKMIYSKEYLTINKPMLKDGLNLFVGCFIGGIMPMITKSIFSNVYLGVVIGGLGFVLLYSTIVFRKGTMFRETLEEVIIKRKKGDLNK